MIIGIFVLTKFRKGQQLHAILASLVYPMDRFLDRELEIEPAGLGVDGCSLVFADRGDHVVLVR